MPTGSRVPAASNTTRVVPMRKRLTTKDMATKFRNSTDTLLASGDRVKGGIGRSQALDARNLGGDSRIVSAMLILDISDSCLHEPGVLKPRPDATEVLIGVWNIAPNRVELKVLELGL